MSGLSPTSIMALDWAIRSFGPEHVYDPAVRSLRTAEEAIELAQAMDVPREKMHACVDMVYDKPPGAEHQEAGGVLLTMAIYCASRGVDPEEWLVQELRRVLAKDPAHFRARNEAKLAKGMT